jgi:hypothetical protein
MGGNAQSTKNRSMPGVLQMPPSEKGKEEGARRSITILLLIAAALTVLG